MVWNCIERKMTINLGKKFLLLTTLILFFMGSLGYGQDSGLRVEIKPEQTTVKNDEEISVMTKIINTSHTDQHLQIWGCSYYDNWSVDSPFIKLQDWPCEKNPINDVVLKPKEKYENKLSLKITVPAEEVLVKQINFRLGFKPWWELTKGNIIPNSSVVWSNPITIKIKE